MWYTIVMLADTPQDKPITPERAESEAGNQKADTTPTGVTVHAELNIPTSAIESYNTNQKKSYRLERWILIVEVLTLVAVSFYACVAYHQLKEMQTAAEAAKEGADAAKDAARTAGDTLTSSKESFQAEQRPYLIADTPQFLVGPPAPGETSANVAFRNVGKTPAMKIRMQIALLRFHPTKKTPAGIEKVFAFMRSSFQSLTHKLDLSTTGKYADEARIDVAPNDSRFSTAELEKPLLASEIPELRGGDLTLFYIGVIRYTDALNGSYETQFCYYYFGTYPTIWHICDSHNTIK